MWLPELRPVHYVPRLVDRLLAVADCGRAAPEGVAAESGFAGSLIETCKGVNRGGEASTSAPDSQQVEFAAGRTQLVPQRSGEDPWPPFPHIPGPSHVVVSFDMPLTPHYSKREEAVNHMRVAGVKSTNPCLKV